MEISNNNLCYFHNGVWLEIIKACQLRWRLLLFCVSKLFQKLIEDNQLNCLRIYHLVSIPDIGYYKNNLEVLTKVLLTQCKFIQGVKRQNTEIVVLTIEDLKTLCDHPPLDNVINMLNLDESCLDYEFDPDKISCRLSEQVLNSLNITMLSLVNMTLIPDNFAEIWSERPILKALNLRGCTLKSTMDLSTASFKELWFDMVQYRDNTRIKMPLSLEAIYIALGENGCASDTEFLGAHCDQLSKL
jgi:hypothetical protein